MRNGQVLFLGIIFSLLACSCQPVVTPAVSELPKKSNTPQPIDEFKKMEQEMESEMRIRGYALDVANIRGLLRRCPYPFDVKDDDAVNRTTIVTIIKQVATHELEPIRHVIAIDYQFPFLKCPPSKEVAHLSTIYVLNRALFAIPEHDSQPVGCFLKAGTDELPFTRLWPLVVENNRHIVFRGTFGGYSGPLYPVLREFDWMRELYGRRSVLEKLN